MAFVVIFIVALLSSLAFQGTRGLFDRDETRYAECAREMLVTGNWLIPTRNFKPHLTKPPLTYWAMAASMKVFGVNEWGARIPNAVAFSITVVLVGLIGSRLLGSRFGPIASLIYLTSIVPFAASNIVTTDTLLVMWEVAAVWAFLSGYQANSKSEARLWFVLMAVFWGLGFLTKGPAVFPVAAGLALFWLIRRGEFKAFPASPVVLIVFFITGLWWYGVVFKVYPWAKGLILEEQVTGRLFSPVFHRNSAWYAPLYLYAPMILLGLAPWCILWIRAARQFRGRWSGDLLRQESLFLSLWWAVPLVVFTLARSRLPLYILPVFAPMAIFSSQLVKDDTLGQKRFYKIVGVTLAIFIGLKFAAAHAPMPQDARQMYRAFSKYIEQAGVIDTFEGQFLDGLSFYSKKPVEYLPYPTKSGIHVHTCNSFWDEEVKEISTKGPEIFVLDLRKQAQTAHLHSLGLCLQEVSRYGRYGLFEVSANGCAAD